MEALDKLLTELFSDPQMYELIKLGVFIAVFVLIMKLVEWFLDI